MKVTIHEAKTHLSKLIQEAIHGEEVIISRGTQPVVRIVPIDEGLPDRRLDGLSGLIEHIADDFDAEIDHFEDYE